MATKDVDRVSAVAAIEPVSQAAVAFPVSGTVATVDVAPGDRVALDGEDVSALLRAGGGGGAARPVSLLPTIAQPTITLVSAVGADEIAAAQQAVLSAQHAVDTARGAAAAELDSATTVCAAVGADVDPSDPSAATSTIQACDAALQDVVSAQGAVSDAVRPRRRRLEARRPPRPVRRAVAVDADDDVARHRGPGDHGGAERHRCHDDGAERIDADRQPGERLRAVRRRQLEPQLLGGHGIPVVLVRLVGPRLGRRWRRHGRLAELADLISYQAAVDSASGAVTAAQQAVDQATIVSPITGTVLDVGTAVGDEVSAGSSTQRIVVEGAGGYEATASLDLDAVVKVKVGQAATLLPDGATTTVTGRVVGVSAPPDSTSSSDTTTYRVTIGLDGDTSSLRNGALGSLSTVTATATGVVAVPSSGVTTEGTRHVVRVVDGDSETTTVVRIGVVGDTWTEITDGLSVGQQVVVADLGAALPSAATSTSETATRRFAATLDGGGGFAPPGG